MYTVQYCVYMLLRIRIQHKIKQHTVMFIKIVVQVLTKEGTQSPSTHNNKRTASTRHLGQALTGRAGGVGSGGNSGGGRHSTGHGNPAQPQASQADGCAERRSQQVGATNSGGGGHSQGEEGHLTAHHHRIGVHARAVVGAHGRLTQDVDAIVKVEVVDRSGPFVIFIQLTPVKRRREATLLWNIRRGSFVKSDGAG